MFYKKIIERDYKVVIIRSIYDTIKNDVVRDIIPKLIEFKIDGYSKEYPKNVLPFDASDFVATHLLLCKINPDSSLDPVLGFKSVTLEKCDDHKFEFPMLSLFNNDKSAIETRNKLESLIAHHRSNGTSSQLAYNCSFTIKPSLRQNKELMKYLWDITFSLLTNYYIEYNINNILALCATKFNIHKKKEQLGWEYLKSEQNKNFIKPFATPSFYNAEVVPMILKDPLTSSLESSLKFKNMWDSKLVFEAINNEVIKRTA